MVHNPPKVTYKYYRKLGSKKVFLVLHGGGSEGIETPFIITIIGSLSQSLESVFGFNFPYCDRGEEESSGPELKEETDCLSKVIKFLYAEGYETIYIVAKSLGGIIASYWLEQRIDQTSKVRLVILGYVKGSVRTEALTNKLVLVLRGENDRFGNANAIEEELKTHGLEAEVIEIAHADHSYRNSDNEPIYQAEVVKLLLKKLL